MDSSQPRPPISGGVSGYNSSLHHFGNAGDFVHGPIQFKGCEVTSVSTGVACGAKRKTHTQQPSRRKNRTTTISVTKGTPP